MGAALLLVLLVGPTAYARARAHAQAQPRTSAFNDVVYVPKMPRRALIDLWPWVMNQYVSEKVGKKLSEREKNREYLKIKCNYESHSVIEPISLPEVIDNLNPFKEESRAPDFFTDLVPKLIVWLSAEVIECGFNTIFAESRQALYRFITNNRSFWLKILRKLTYILLIVVAVIHHKTGLPTNESLSWLEEWPESYEYLHKHWHMYRPKNLRNGRGALDYLERVILSSFDIVTAWLFDVIVVIGKKSKKSDAVCAMDQMAEWRWKDTMTWINVEKTDGVTGKMRDMADMFITCNVTSGCESYDPINIQIAHMPVAFPYERKLDVRDRMFIPDRIKCVHTCTFHQTVVPYKFAYLATEAGYDLYCTHVVESFLDVSVYSNSHNIVLTANCYPLIVEKYIYDLTNMICCSPSEIIEQECCKPRERACVNIMFVEKPKYNELDLNLTLTKDMTTFEEFLLANAKLWGP